MVPDRTFDNSQSWTSCAVTRHWGAMRSRRSDPMHPAQQGDFPDGVPRKSHSASQKEPSIRELRALLCPYGTLGVAARPREPSIGWPSRKSKVTNMTVLFQRLLAEAIDGR